MAMAVDSQQRSLGSFAFNAMGPYQPQPQFTNPWSSAPSSSAQLFPAALAASNVKQEAPRLGHVSMPYASVPISAPVMAPTSLSAPYAQPDMLPLQQELLTASRMSQEPSYGSDQSYSSGPSPQLSAQAYTPASASFDYQSTRPVYRSSQQMEQGGDRRSSHPGSSSTTFLNAPLDVQRQRQASLNDISRILGPSQMSRDGFGDAIDAGRGIMALSQDITPRNIFEVEAQARDQVDSYGFPSTHSSSSSVSSASPYPSYYGSMDSSMSEYSSTSESVEPMPPSSRKLPRPQSLMTNLPPAPQSMMGQFNSKVSASTQKKHKCKVCDKRFTRPSSLQTHMYSHTGEKRKP